MRPRPAPRRPVLRALVAALLLACGCARSPQETYEAFPRGPVPVVLFVVDTLRADRLGCYGHDRDTSPALDAFAREGVLYERCLGQSTWTKPATASILTGLYPAQHTAVHLLSVLPAEVSTLAEELAARGYRTAAFGESGMIFGEGSGFEQGFEVFRSSWELGDPIGAKEREGSAGVLVEGALEWLGALEPDEPFFLYLHLTDPHAPYDPPAPELVVRAGDLAVVAVQHVLARGRGDGPAVLERPGEELALHAELLSLIHI